MPLIDPWCAVIFAAIGVGYVLIGFVLLSVMDASDRFNEYTDRIEGAWSLLALLVWPATAAWLWWRARRG